jgi:hypothetical protein
MGVFGAVALHLTFVNPKLDVFGMYDGGVRAAIVRASLLWMLLESSLIVCT